MNIAILCLAATYILAISLFLRSQSPLSKRNYVIATLVFWPVLLLSTWGGERNYPFVQSGLVYFSHVLIPLIMGWLHLIIMARIIKQPPKTLKAWFPAILVGLCCVGLVTASSEKLPGWLQYSPVGDPLTNWPFYLLQLTVGFGLLLLGVAATERIQEYHHYLNDQVVDPSEYRLKSLKLGYGFVVASALGSLAIVAVNATGVIAIGHWTQINGLLWTSATLVALLVILLPFQSVPSPLDYPFLANKNVAKAVLKQTLAQADSAIIEHKLYKKVGLTIEELARTAKLDPTLLAKATRELRQQSFRRYVYEYRLDYAKKVLLRSDTNIASVAKRLGLNSSNVLNDVLVEHLKNFK